MINKRAGPRATGIVLTTALALLGAAGSAHAGIAGGVTAQPGGSCALAGCFHLEPAIVFSATRDTPGATTPGTAAAAAEIYLMNPGTTNPRRLTSNAVGDGFATLSPDGKRIVFDRMTTGVCGGKTWSNISDLWVMDADGSNQRFLARGSSAAWSPDGKDIAFHASASYYASGGQASGCPIKANPGAATTDSDIFVANVDDLLAGAGQPRNITGTPGLIEDDADWSPAATTAPHGQRIVFTAHPATDNPNVSNQAEIYVTNPDGSFRQQLTSNLEEERAAAWSPDGTAIVYSCRIGGGMNTFQICVMNADGTNVQQLTGDSVPNLTATWSPDGQHIVFNKLLPPLPPAFPGEVLNYQLFTLTQNPDGTWSGAEEITCAPQQNTPGYPNPCPAGVTPTPGINLAADWGMLRVKN